ncbi:putative membrane protein [Escherichia coli P0299917.5]|nr:putative membrane protein [Escherichia coli P0299917.2]ENC51882.1 putative membrane protein [Escherichia coli P0299917.5]
MAAGFTDLATGKVIAGFFKVLTGFGVNIMAGIMGGPVPLLA